MYLVKTSELFEVFKHYYNHATGASISQKIGKQAFNNQLREIAKDPDNDLDIKFIEAGSTHASVNTLDGILLTKEIGTGGRLVTRSVHEVAGDDFAADNDTHDPTPQKKEGNLVH